MRVAVAIRRGEMFSDIGEYGEALKELERHKSQLLGYRGNPNISEAALDEVIARIDHAFAGLNQLPGKAGAALTGNEWLMSIRSRISIPGGTCEFDLPAYYAWQQFAPARRKADLAQWTASLMPLAEALSVLLDSYRRDADFTELGSKMSRFFLRNASTTARFRGQSRPA